MITGREPLLPQCVRLKAELALSCPHHLAVCERRGNENTVCDLWSAEVKGNLQRCQFLRGRKSNHGSTKHVISSGSKILLHIERIKNLFLTRDGLKASLSHSSPHTEKKECSVLLMSFSLFLTSLIDLFAHVAGEKIHEIGNLFTLARCRTFHSLSD